MSSVSYRQQDNDHSKSLISHPRSIETPIMPPHPAPALAVAGTGQVLLEVVTSQIILVSIVYGCITTRRPSDLQHLTCRTLHNLAQGCASPRQVRWQPMS